MVGKDPVTIARLSIVMRKASYLLGDPGAKFDNQGQLDTVNPALVIQNLFTYPPQSVLAGIANFNKAILHTSVFPDDLPSLTLGHAAAVFMGGESQFIQDKVNSGDYLLYGERGKNASDTNPVYLVMIGVFTGVSQPREMVGLG